MCTLPLCAAVTHRRVGQVSSKYTYAQMEINVQRSRRDVGADRGERPVPPRNLLTTTSECVGNEGIVTSRQIQYDVD